MQSLPLGLFPPSFVIPTSGRWTPYPLRRLWLFFFRESLLYVQAPSPILFFIVSVLLTDILFLVLWQVATYVKGLVRKANLTKGSAKAAISYKANVASLTSERADLRAQIRDLTEELVKHRSDLKHALTARARAEDREKKARKDVKVVEDELRLAREELQAVKGDLCAKVTMLDLVRQEALEAGNSVERLTEELDKLRINLERQEALASRRGKVIAELKDEACTQWAFRWLAFQLRASRTFLGQDFNIQLSDDEVKNLLLRLRLMGLLRCFQGPLIVLPCLMIFRFLRRPALLLCPLEPRLLTPLFP